MNIKSTLNKTPSLLPCIVFYICIAYPCTSLFAQTFTGYYGASQANSIKQTADQGYIVAGFTNASGAGGNDMYLIKTDINGNVLWTKTYGSTGDDEATAVQITSDGGYIIAGFTNSSSFSAGGYDMYLVKTNSNGDTLWNRTYGGTGNDQATSVQQTSDGGYIIGGYTYSYGGKGGFSDGYLIKTNSSGDTLWTRVFGGTAGNEVINSVWQCKDKGYILGGYTHSFPSTANTRFLVLKTDSNGVISGGIAPTFQKYLGSSNDDEATSVQQTSDGGYILGGFTKASTGASTNTRGSGYDMALVKLTNSSSPAITFQYHYGGQVVLDGSSDDFCYSVQQTADNGYILGGSSYVNLSQYYREMYMIKTDSAGIGGGYNNPLYPVNGNTSWSYAYGIYGNGDDNGYSAIQTKDGGYVIAGENSGSKIFVCKTDPVGTDCDMSSFPIYEQGSLTWTLGTPVTELYKGGGIVNKPITMANTASLTPTFDCTSHLSLLPVANFASSDSAFCSEGGNCINFFDHSTGPATWHWLFPGAFPDSSNQQNPTGICYYTPGTYAVTLIVTNANGSDTLTVAPMITVGQAPPAPTLTLSGDTIRCSHAYSYQWYFNGSPIPGATDSLYIMLQDGSYNVFITDNVGCGRFGNGILFTSLNELTGLSPAEVFPNPSNGTFEITFTSAKPTLLRIEFQNMLAEIVYSKEVNALAGKDKLKVMNQNLPDGIYLLKITDGTKQAIKKIIIQK